MPTPLSGIRHIIFDLGGVLLNIDYGKTPEAFAALGLDKFDELYSQMRQTPLFDDLETGAISGGDFVNEVIQQALPLKLSARQVTDAWNAMLLDFPLRRLQLLQQLRIRYDLFLLSNTNEIHELAFNELLRAQHGLPSIAVFFDQVYYSHRVGLRKPGEAVFRRILEEQELKPEHTLFIDDSPQHIATARALGIRTIFLEKGMTIEDDVFRPVG